MLQSGPRRLHRGQREQSTNSPVTNGAALILDEVDESAQRRGQMSTTRIVEERPREVLPPRRQHGLQSAAVEMGAQPLFKEMDDAEPSDGCADRKIHRRAESHHQRPNRVDPYNLAVALELPGWRRATGELPAQAGVGEQVTRLLPPAARIEIVG